MLSKTIIASGLTLALSVPAMGALAWTADEPAELQEQNQLMVSTQDQVATQNNGDDTEIQVQERNRVHQDGTDTASEAARDQERLQNRTQDPQECTNPDCPNPDGPQYQERVQARHIDTDDGVRPGPSSDGQNGQSGLNGQGAQDCTGPIAESAQDGTGNQYGKK